jgi:hypothetical protein
MTTLTKNKTTARMIGFLYLKNARYSIVKTVTGQSAGSFELITRLLANGLRLWNFTFAPPLLPDKLAMLINCRQFFATAKCDFLVRRYRDIDQSCVFMPENKARPLEPRANLQQFFMSCAELHPQQ